MRSFGKWLGRILVVIFIVFGGLWAFAPAETVDREISFDSSAIGPDVQAWLDQREFQFSNLNPAAAKRIVWAGGKGEKTPLAVIYVHGFSASAEEIRPVPDDVAKALGANLFFTRLKGHGLPGEAMASATAGDWIEDMAEAMAIGRRLGDRVLVLSTSTGGTLAAIAATDLDLSADLAGIVIVSPNFGVRPLAGKILDLPFARIWGPLMAGVTRSFPPQNAAQGMYWTTTYPTIALFPMAAIVRHAAALDYRKVTTPVLVLYSPDDQVVDPAKTLGLMANWGGDVQLEPRNMGPNDDVYSHVIAGDILSPGQTKDTVDLIVAWAKKQGF